LDVNNGENPKRNHSQVMEETKEHSKLIVQGWK